MDENPYQAPKAQITYNDPSLGQRPIPASKGTRFLNFVLDYVAFIALSFIAGLVIGAAGRGDTLEEANSLMSTLLSLGIWFAYYIGMEGTSGRTIGKMITGTKVVDENGGKPSFGKIVGRTFARMIPFEIFSFLGAEGRGWHDSLPGTYVVKGK
jgi:uncharacterized RDD family membrane protein YckC